MFFFFPYIYFYFIFIFGKVKINKSKSDLIVAIRCIWLVVSIELSPCLIYIIINFKARGCNTYLFLLLTP